MVYIYIYSTVHYSSITHTRRYVIFTRNIDLVSQLIRVGDQWAIPSTVQYFMFEHLKSPPTRY